MSGKNTPIARPLITQAVVDAALHRAREERALAFRAALAALFRAFRRAEAPLAGLPAAAR